MRDEGDFLGGLLFLLFYFGFLYSILGIYYALAYFGVLK